MSAELVFYFDYISPYAYIAWTQIHRLAEARGARVRPAPILFAALLNAHGQKGPAEIPAKRAYTFKDAFRKAHRLGLPRLQPPPSHPFNPLLALRATALLEGSPAQRGVIDALFGATWAGGPGIESPEALVAALSHLDVDAAKLVSRANDEEAKARVRAGGEAALAAGAFGVPTVVAGGELFWGVDALDALADFLDGKDPVPDDLLARWKDLPATAQRRPPR